jgi:hypothetical protein
MLPQRTFRCVVLVPGFDQNHVYFIPAGPYPEWPRLYNNEPLTRSVLSSALQAFRLGTGERSLSGTIREGDVNCTKQVTHQDGIFCANFGHQMGTFRNAIQHGVWTAAEVPGEDFLVYRERRGRL